MSDDEGVTPDEVVAHITPALVTPRLGKGTLGTWRSPATPGLRAGVCLAAKLGLTCKQTAHEGRMRVRRLTLSRSREGLRAISRGQNRTRENRPSGIAGGSWETWQMAEIGTHAADRKGGHGHSSPSCARAQVLPDGGRAIDAYMKRLVKYPLALDAASFFPGTPPVSARCPFNQPKGCAREPTDQRRVSSSHSSSLPCSQRGDSPLYSRSHWHIMCRRTGGFERRSSALFRTALTCGQTSVRACSSSLTTSLT